MSTTTQKIELTRVKHDANGNPRYVCHFLNLINDSEGAGLSLDQKYSLALSKSRAIGGKKFHNKQFGGGIVFQSYNVNNLSKSIIELKNK